MKLNKLKERNGNTLTLRGSPPEPRKVQMSSIWFLNVIDAN